MFYVYCLISKVKDKFHYYGFTADINIRLKYHQAGKVNTTRRYLPVELLGYKEFDSRDAAIAYEKKLKSSFTERSKFITELTAHLPVGRQVT